MRLLVLGATGRTGSHLLDRGLADGHEVTAFARRPSVLARYGSRIRVVQGDIAVASSVNRAIPGQDAVLSALGSPTLRPNTVLSDGIRHVLAAMKDHEVPRLLAMSALGVGETSGQVGPVYNLVLIPLLLRNTFLEKERMEAYIKAADVEWTIVRPGALTSGPARGRYRTALADVRPPRFPRISRADVAAFMLAEVHQRRYVRQAVGLWDEPQR
jgi:putative NADH-flavin reductase